MSDVITKGGAELLDQISHYLMQGKIVVMVGSARMLAEALIKRALLDEMPTDEVPIQ